jgi:hypothetical protein
LREQAYRAVVLYLHREESKLRPTTECPIYGCI